MRTVLQLVMSGRLTPVAASMSTYERMLPQDPPNLRQQLRIWSASRRRFESCSPGQPGCRPDPSLRRVMQM